MKINLVTYNILFGADQEVFNSLSKTKVDHEDGDLNLFCLQECRSSDIVEDILKATRISFDNYNEESHLDNKLTRDNLGLVTYSNLKPIHIDRINLPMVEKSYFNVQTYFLDEYPQYGALITYYKLNERIIRVTNLHLDVAGGFKQRKIQIEYLLTELNQTKVDIEIICGDFNTIGLRGKFKNKTPKEIKLFQDIQKDYSLVNSGYTSDIKYAFNPSIPCHGLIRMLPKMGITLQQRLDWILFQNLHLLDSKVLYNLVGSDHYPLVAKFEC